MAARLRILRAARHFLAGEAPALAELLADRRPAAETLTAEILPLLEAIRFLERAAPRLLAPRRLGWRGRPLWLPGVAAELRRDPHGAVLVLAPSNYPLFLPGAQIVQALAAGNAVCAKPAPGGAAVLGALAGTLRRAGLPDGVFHLLADDVATGQAAARAGFDRIVLTGSAETGRSVLRAAAETLTPCTMELSGNDAAFVLPGADLDLVASGLAYGMRLNGGATCIAPHRVFVPRDAAPALEQALFARLAGAQPVTLPPRVADLVASLLAEAETAGARLSARPAGATMPPVVVAGAGPTLRLLREDVFAPVLALVPVADMAEALALARDCPYALGASVWGPEAAARSLAARVPAGSVVVNDLIAPTADPRLPFGGRGRSGFGVTRGVEGLLEMTVLRTVSVRRGRFRPHLDPLRPGDAALFAALTAVLHGGGGGRIGALRALVRAGRRRTTEPAGTEGGR